MADDLGFNDLDWKDNNLHTPNLRHLAFHENTAQLTNSYVNQLCTPTRSAFMTGYYPFRTGTQNGVFLHMEPSGIPTMFPFLSENMRSLDYSTYLVGKWHLGYCKKEYLPTNRGFDYFYGFYGPQTGYFNHSADQYHRELRRVVKGLDLFEEIGSGKSTPDFSQNGVYSTDLFTDVAMSVLDNHNNSKPFFMFLSYQAVHPPLQNGGTVEFGASNAPLRGEKDSIWEGGTRTTTFIHSPRFIKRGGERKMLFHVVDWHASILSMAGLKIDSYGDGINQWDYIRTGKPKFRRYQFIYNIDSKGSAIRDGDYKLITGNVDRKQVKEKNRIRLFRISIDPTESKDIARQNPKIVRKILAKLENLKKYMHKNVRRPLSLDGSPELFNGTYSSYWCDNLSPKNSSTSG
ncbi:unnamed protein product [Caenorhabditis bovis]|uniref:Sulfatase N-terminal domain-containing protein n=1 Tax=Caenorhabditis bovis TaxID=2654633 RepID=A0A8S1EF76_9PELO|nr:unnamed protein product [Caenorhabditis bovis]